MPLPLALTRCKTLNKDGLGTLHLHAAAWRPGKLREMLFQPEGRPVMHLVPEGCWEDVLAAGSFEQVMALVRSDGTRSVS